MVGDCEKKNKLFETTNFDNAICLAGYGKFHLELILVCALCIITVGFQNGLSSYVFPAAQCELQLTSFELGLLNVVFLVGGTVSSFLWGILADICGRKKVLILTHFLNAIITILCALNPSTISLVICRFLNGFLIGAPGSIIFSYIAEFQPPKYRSTSVCYCGLFFTASWLILPVLAYLILPIEVTFRFHDVIVLTPWRVFMIVMAIPEIFVGFWFMRLPESPKFFMAKGETREALLVLREMYSKNSGKLPERFPVKYIISDVRNESSNPIGGVCKRKTVRVLQKILRQIKTLFYPPLTWITVLTCSIMFTNMFGVFGLGLWLPELFIRFQQFQDLHPNSTVTVKQLAILSDLKNQTCEPSFDSAVIQSTIAMGLSSMIYNGIAGWYSSRIQLKFIPLFSMFLGGISAGSIYWLTSSTQNLIVACIFQSAMITANMTIGSVVVELFPTKVGGIAICLIMCAGRIGAMGSNVVFGYFMDSHCEIPIFVVAVIVVIGAFLCLLIPNKDRIGSSDASTKNDYISSNQIEISVISKSVD